MISLATIVLAVLHLTSAQFAPAGTSVHFESRLLQFQRDGDHNCLTALGNSDGAQVQFAQCSTADPASIAWTITAGSVIGPGTGPAGPIRIFGNKCLDVTNGVNADGTKLQIWTCSGGPNQNFNVNSDLTFTWSNSNKCVDLTNGQPTPGLQMQIWTCFSGDTNQQWAVRPATVPSQILWTAAPGNLCLAAGSSTNGAPVFIDTCTSAPHLSTESRTWALPASGVQGTISTFSGTKCLDVTNGVIANGTKLQVWDCTPGDTNQQFTTDGNGVIGWNAPNFGGLVVDVTNGDHTPGTQTQVFSFGDGQGGLNSNQVFFV